MGINIKNNIKTLLEVAGKCGGFTRELAEELGVKYRRLKQLEDLNYINRPNIFTVRENDTIKTKYVYTVSSEGETFLKREALCTALAPLTGYEHTKASEHVYMELRKNYEASDILNEQEQRYHYFKDEIKDMDDNKIIYSIADFCILKDNDDIEFVEVTTKNYRDSDLTKKENYCRYFNKSPNYINRR